MSKSKARPLVSESDIMIKHIGVFGFVTDGRARMDDEELGILVVG